MARAAGRARRKSSNTNNLGRNSMSYPMQTGNAPATPVPNRVNFGESFVKFSWHKKTFVQYCILMGSLYNVDIRKKEKEKDRKMRNLLVFNTIDELLDYLNENEVETLVGDAAFGLDLLDFARANDNEVEIGRDGGFLQIDEMGYVIRDFCLSWKGLTRGTDFW